jgi:hypothetical protein
MAGETFASERCQSRAYATASLADRSLESDVAGFLECRQLLRQRGVREPELVTYEGEICPVGRGEVFSVLKT